MEINKVKAAEDNIIGFLIVTFIVFTIRVFVEFNFPMEVALNFALLFLMLRVFYEINKYNNL